MIFNLMIAVASLCSLLYLVSASCEVLRWLLGRIGCARISSVENGIDLLKARMDSNVNKGNDAFASLSKRISNLEALYRTNEDVTGTGPYRTNEAPESEVGVTRTSRAFVLGQKVEVMFDDDGFEDSSGPVFPATLLSFRKVDDVTMVMLGVEGENEPQIFVLSEITLFHPGETP